LPFNALSTRRGQTGSTKDRPQFVLDTSVREEAAGDSIIVVYHLLTILLVEQSLLDVLDGLIRKESVHENHLEAAGFDR